MSLIPCMYIFICHTDSKLCLWRNFTSKDKIRYQTRVEHIKQGVDVLNMPFFVTYFNEIWLLTKLNRNTKTVYSSWHALKYARVCSLESLWTVLDNT